MKAPLRHDSEERRKALVGLEVNTCEEAKDAFETEFPALAPHLFETNYVFLIEDIIYALKKIGKSSDADYWDRAQSNPFFMIPKEDCELVAS